MTPQQTPADIILASTSASRRAILDAAGVRFISVPPNVDENAAKRVLLRDNMNGENLARALAELKAIEVSARFPDALVIGADQVLVCEGDFFNKAETLGAVRDILRSLRGKEHSLIAAVVIATGAVPIWQSVETAHLKMRNFSDAFLDGYIAAEGDALLGCVGCYRIEGIGAQLFSRIAGDTFTIRGLPLVPVLDVLRQNKALPA